MRQLSFSKAKRNNYRFSFSCINKSEDFHPAFSAHFYKTYSTEKCDNDCFVIKARALAICIFAMNQPVLLCLLCMFLSSQREQTTSSLRVSHKVISGAHSGSHNGRKYTTLGVRSLDRFGQFARWSLTLFR